MTRIQLLIPLLAVFLSLPSLAQIEFKNNYHKGLDLFQKNELDSSAQYLLNAISSFKNSDSTQLGSCHMYLAIIYGKVNKIDLSEEYIDRAQLIFQKIKNDTLQIRSLNILGNIYSSRKEYAKAIDTFNHSLQLAQKNRLPYLEGSILNNLGVNYYNQNSFAQALLKFNDGLKLAEKLNSNYGKAHSYINIGKCYLKQGRFREAESSLKTGLNYSERSNDLYLLMTANEELYKLYELNGNMALGHLHLKKYIQFKDSLASKEIKEKMIAYESLFQNQQKKIEIIRLKNDAQSKEIDLVRSQGEVKSLNKTITITVSLLVGILFSSIFIYTLYKKKKELNEQLELKNTRLSETLDLNKKFQAALNKELDSLKQLAFRKQMNPHFIFNSLNSIQNYILTKPRLESVLYLTEFSKLIRQVLENSEKDNITLKYELNLCEQYIALEHRRFEKNFGYKINIDENCNLEIPVPTLILQPFVENAIWHGLQHTDVDALLQIDVVSSGTDGILISITDNGIGRKEAAKKATLNATKQRSVGIELTSKRMELNNMVNAVNIKYEIIDLYKSNGTSHGTQVNIYFNR